MGALNMMKHWIYNGDVEFKNWNNQPKGVNHIADQTKNNSSDSQW
jgi:hypothetical protein